MLTMRCEFIFFLLVAFFSADFLKNCKLHPVCKNDLTLLKVVIQKTLFMFYCMIIIMKTANFWLISPQMPMLLFSRLFHSLQEYACFLLLVGIKCKKKYKKHIGTFRNVS
jgi:hypothetical protein